MTPSGEVGDSRKSAAAARLAQRVTARFGPRRVFYGWYIASAGATSNFFLIGIVLYGMGVIYEPMRREMGWSMAAVAAGASLRSLEHGLMAPVTGFLIDRFGPRSMALIGISFISIGLLMFSQSRSIHFYYVSSVVIALGQSLGSIMPYSLAVMNWFERKRGRAIGLLNTGNGLGYLVVTLIALLVSWVGWRTTLVISAGTVFAVCMPLALVLRLRPEPYGYLPDGDESLLDDGDGYASSNRNPEDLGMSVVQALRVPAFYLLAFTTALGGAIQITWVTLQVPHLINVGFSTAAAGLFVGVYGVVQVLLRLGSGWVGDTIGQKKLFMLSYLLQAVGMALFAFFSPNRLWLIPFYYATWATGHAAWVIASSTIAADFFGTRRYATIRGLSSTLTMPLGISAPFIAGLMFDHTGSYRDVFLIYAAIVSTGALWLLLIRRPTWTEYRRRTGSSASVVEG